MFAQRKWHMTAACLLFIGAASMVEAQQVVASSFDQLRMVMRLGDTVKVTETSGHETTGKVADLSSSSLTLLMAGSSRQIAESEVAIIHRRRHGDLATGAKWGLGIGAGLGALLGASVGAGRYTPYIAAVYGGLGTGIGVGISAMITTQDVIYGKRASAKLTVSPLVTRERKGMSVSLGF